MVIEPLVTVNILSFNRREELRVTLTKVYAQDYKNIEVIVVDNASSDGSPEMVEREFPDVKLIQLKKNIGIAGWNEGFKIAKGKYVLVLDDDSYPDITTIRYGVQFLEKDLSIGIVTFNIFNLSLNESETNNFNLINPFLFHGCGTLFRFSVITLIGYYDVHFFLYYNEIDYTIRCYDHNIKIRYLPEMIIFHRPILSNVKKNTSNYHTHKLKYEQYFSGHIRFLIKNFNYINVLIYGLKWILNRFIIAILYGYYLSFLKSLVKLPIVIISSIKYHKPVKKTVQKYYNYGNQPLFDRFFFKI